MIDKAEPDLRLATAGVEDAVWRELKSLLGHRRAEGEAGSVATKSIDTIVGEELDISRAALSDCDSVFFDHQTFDASKPNHNLFREPGFKDCDLIRYQPADLWQAVRVIAAVAGA